MDESIRNILVGYRRYFLAFITHGMVGRLKAYDDDHQDDNLSEQKCTIELWNYYATDTKVFMTDAGYLVRYDNGEDEEYQDFRDIPLDYEWLAEKMLDDMQKIGLSVEK